MIVSVILGITLGVLGTIGVITLRDRRRTTPRPGVVPSIESDEVGATGFLADVLDALTVGVVVASPEGDIVYRNARATGLTRATHSEVLVEEAIDNYVRAAIGGRGGCKVLDLFGPPRQVISVTALPLANAGAVAMVEDTTERVLSDAVRTDFVANISHELRTPIGAMAVLAETLSQEEDTAVIHRLATKISDEAMRVGRLIDDLLELSRLEYGGEPARELVSVPAIVLEAVERTQTLADSRRISIDVHQPVLAALVAGDRRQLASALGNLLENAVKYSESGSSVEVVARRSEGNVLLDVRDHGVGIPAKEIDRIFERFYRVDRARSRETGGTGLGLSIARHIVTNHGGEIRVRSVEGSGSTFTIVLPEAQETTP